MTVHPHLHLRRRRIVTAFVLALAASTVLLAESAQDAADAEHLTAIPRP